VAISVPLSCHCERSAAIRLPLAGEIAALRSQRLRGIASALRASQRQVKGDRRPDLKNAAKNASIAE